LAFSDAGVDAYFACAEYISPNNRTAANAAGAYVFIADIDCSVDKANAGRGYRTIGDAVKELRLFCQRAKIPEPSFIIFSGSGIHAYWVLAQFLPREQWQAYARKLKRLMKKCGLLADDTRTADIASVLRVPGTLNYKYEPPRRVEMLRATDKLIACDEMLSALDQACDAAHLEKPYREAATDMPQRATKSPAHTVTPTQSTRLYPTGLLQLLRDALHWLDPDCDDETWKLHRLAPLALAARDNPDVAVKLYQLARSWSNGELRGTPAEAWTTPGGNGKTGHEIFDATWQRFFNQTYAGQPITIRTIFADAKAAGWQDPDDFQVIDDENGAQHVSK
jgi:hypothetical protein